MSPFQWRIEDIERTANEAKRRLYELDALSSRLDRMEHSVREARSLANGLRDELQATQERITTLEDQPENTP